jgi:AraC-like DNA-binding protein
MSPKQEGIMRKSERSEKDAAMEELGGSIARWTDRLDAATAAFQVGYESPSQFSRQYSRLFGAPPLRDITGLRQLVAGERG